MITKNNRINLPNFVLIAKAEIGGGLLQNFQCCTGEAIIEMRETENGGDSTESEGDGEGEGGEVGYQISDY